MSESRVAADVAAMSGGQGGEIASLPAPAPEPVPVPAPTAADPAEPATPEPATVTEPTADQPAQELVPEPKSEPAAQPRERNGLADRNYELRQRARAAEQREAEMRATLDRMNAALERLAPATQPAATPTETAMPRRQDFDDPDAFEIARAEWASERAARRVMEQYQRGEEERRREERTAAERRQQEEQQQAIGRGYQERRAAYMAANPDVDYEAIAESESTPASGAMLQIILTNPKGPEIAVWLGQNRAEAERIARLPTESEQLFEMGIIAAQLRRPAASVTPINRPIPINPVRGGGAPAARSVNDLSMEEIDARVREHAKTRVGGRS